MKLEKILGWSLLIIGIVIIFASLYFSFNIFTNKNQAPEIFKTEEDLSPKETDVSFPPVEDLEKKMEKLVEQQIKNMIPSEFVEKLLNLMSWSIFASILIFAGSRVSGLGIKLMRRGL